MNTKSQRHTGTFEAQDEQGRVYTIHIYTDFTQVHSGGGHSEEVAGLNELLLDNGEHVNDLGNGEYQIVQTGKKLKVKGAR